MPVGAGIGPQQIIPGWAGRLYTDKGVWLAQVNRFHLQLSFTNTKYQPSGSPLEMDVMQAIGVTLTFTETVIKDDLLAQLLDSVSKGVQPVFGFTGSITRPDGAVGRYATRHCVPQGNIDIANVQPGQNIDRAWSFAVNSLPDLQTALG